MRSGELIELQGGSWTTRELREREQATLTLAASRAQEPVAAVTEQTLKEARREAGRELGGSLSTEQRDALETITGQGGVSTLVGQAGTGKGVVLSAATNAWEKDGYHEIGTAIAGATAERLGAEARMQRSLNTNALLTGIHSGRTHLGPDTVVVMDEAGMADTNRLAALVQATSERQSKLVLVGDEAQLSSITAGGMFTELQNHVPTAELSEVHRAQHEWERDAWGHLRQGRASEALASYQAHDRLHITDTREQAAERMVADWDAARQEHPEQRTVMLSDASNVELDRINALAKERRAQAGELGADRGQLPDRPYSLAAGDEVIFTAAFYPPGERRVENGTLAEVRSVDGQSEIAVQTRGAHEQEVHVDTAEFADMRLAYAQHVYKAQGATVDRAFVLTGGWQADRERAYVALSRARERTDIYVSREDLGEQGMDTGAIQRLGEAIAESRAKRASITTPLAERRPARDIELASAIELEPTGGLGPGAGAVPPPGAGTGPTSEVGSKLRLAHEPRDGESEVGRITREQQEHEHDRDRDLGHEIE